LRLMPRQHSGGSKDRLMGVSKRSDVYLCMLLIHGTRSVRYVAERKEVPHSRCLQSLCNRHHKNIVAVVLANKNAHIVWALLSKDMDYLPEGEPVCL